MIPGAATRRTLLVPRRHAGQDENPAYDLHDLHDLLALDRHEAPAPVDVVRRPELYACPPFDPWEPATVKLSM